MISGSFPPLSDWCLIFILSSLPSFLSYSKRSTRLFLGDVYLLKYRLPASFVLDSCTCKLTAEGSLFTIYMESLTLLERIEAAEAFLVKLGLRLLKIFGRKLLLLLFIFRGSLGSISSGTLHKIFNYIDLLDKSRDATHLVSPLLVLSFKVDNLVCGFRCKELYS